tara:strand:- start:873 stop:1337 length:465 start_codon:yes stop_codon:yes gene_type:complete
MAFKMNRGNDLGKASSGLRKSSPNKIIGMGIMKAIRGKDTRLFGNRTKNPGAGGRRGTRRMKGGGIDWEYTFGRVKDFFGMGNWYWNPDWQSLKRGSKKGGGRRQVKKSRGGKKLKPTTIAQRDVYEDFLLGNRPGPSAKAGDDKLYVNKNKKS